MELVLHFTETEYAHLVAAMAYVGATNYETWLKGYIANMPEKHQQPPA